MRIEKFSRLHDCGVFRDFDWPNSLHALSQFNLIYGWNGTGKSTLTRILYCLERKISPTGNVRLAIDGRDVDGSAFATIGASIRVFDRDFVERTVRASTQNPSGNPDVPPIFVIGEKNVENQKRADEARKELAAKQLQLFADQARSQQALSAIDTFCTDQARLIKDLLTGPTSAYNNYDRRNFKSKADAFAKKTDFNPYLLDDTARVSRIQKHQSTIRDKLPKMEYSLPDLNAAYIDVTSLCSRTVTSEAIESLKSDPGVASWVKQGRDLHADRQSATCLYCAQAIPESRTLTLNKHFNDAYQTLLDEITQRSKRIALLEDRRNKVRPPKKTEVYDHLAAKLQADLRIFEELLAQIKSRLEFLSRTLEIKLKAPFEPIPVTEQAPSLDGSVVGRVNSIIDGHNAHSDSFANEIKKAREEIECANVAAAMGKYQQLLNDSKDAANAVTSAHAQSKLLETEISTLDRELREHRRPADELNHDLQHYLGHADLQLSVIDSGYRIMRGGQTATRLSEGEQTAISLLYFLKSLSSKDFKLDEGIIVLDDPVCSLDANALFSAFGYIKERTKAAKQLIILTHNFMFFRQVRQWYHKLPNQKKKDISLRPARFFMLQCNVVNGQRQSKICSLDKLLEEYESDYHYTFSLIHELANTPSQPLHNYFVAPNLARKLMETFLAFHAPGPGGESNFAKLDDIKFDEHKKQRVLRFLNEHSHSSAIGGDQQDFSGLSETPAVLKDLLRLIEVANKAHFDGMIALLSPALP